MRMNSCVVAALASALFLIAGASHALGAETVTFSEKQKIETLIRAIAKGKDLTFVRNGKAYNSATAANFLRRKWEANESMVKTARDFIDKIASFSATSGEQYRLRFKDGQEINSRDFLLAELASIEKDAQQTGHAPHR